MKTSISLLTLSLSTLLLFSGCTLFNADLKTARQLEGEWEIYSMTIDGEEYIGSWFTRAVIEFEEYDRTDDEGDFILTYSYPTGETEHLPGQYVLDKKGENLELYYDNGVYESWDLQLDKDDFEMDANLEGYAYFVKAERN